MDLVVLAGQAMRWAQGQAGQLLSVRFTQNGSLAVADIEGEGDEATVAGLRTGFGPQNGVTGIAPVQALPTTAAQWLLYNPASNTATAFIDEIGVLLVSGTAGAGIILLGKKVYGKYLPSAPPTASAANMGFDNRGASAKVSPLVVASGQTLATAVPFWDVLAETPSTNTAVLSVDCVNRDVRGKIALPPGQGLALAVCSPAGTTPLYAPFGSYREYQSPQNAA